MKRRLSSEAAPVQPETEAVREFKTKNGWVQFALPAGAPQLTNEMLDAWETQGYEGEFRREFSFLAGCEEKD